jgi:hypothetical protein
MAQEAEQMDLSTTLHYNIVIGTLIGDYNYQIDLPTLPTDSSTCHSLSEYFWANYKRDKKICALQACLASQPPIATINDNTPTAPHCQASYISYAGNWCQSMAEHGYFTMSSQLAPLQTHQIGCRPICLGIS